MINRRGTIFNSGHFRYEEISNLERALADSGAVDRGRG